MFFFRRKSISSYRRKWAKPKLYSIIALALLFCAVITCYGGKNRNWEYIFRLAGSQEAGLQQIILSSLPALPSAQTNNQRFDFIPNLLAVVTGLDSGSPAAIVGSELNFWPDIPVIQPVYKVADIIEGKESEEDFYLPGQDDSLEDWIAVPHDEFPPVELNGEPMVLIYTTHNAESYKPSDGRSKLEGKNGGVAAVSKTLAEALERKHSIKTVYSEVIHDYPDWTKSYVNSMRTAQQLLKEYPKIQMVIDIHRDAGLSTRWDTLVKIGGRETAKVMIVVGNEHDRWKKNLAFAEKIEKEANALYPGLMKCIRVAQERRYNQHLHPRSLLFEFGSDLNTRQDALNAAELMADVIAAVLKGT